MNALAPEIAAAWRALRPPLPLRPGAAAIAWVVTGILAVAVQDDYHCTPADPCGADWLGTVAFGLVVVAALGTLVDPLAGAVAGAVVGPLGAGFDASGSAQVAVMAAFGVSGLLSVVSYVLDARSRRARLALLAPSGELVQVPDEALDRPLRTARLLLLLSAASMLLAAALGGWVASKASNERARQRRAPVVDATVVSYDAEDMTVTLEVAGERDTLDVYGVYDAGETVPVWDLGDGLRPVGEPYDASFPGVLPILAVALGLVLARRAALVRAEVRALRLGTTAWEVPVGPATSGVVVIDPDTYDKLFVVPIDVDAVAETLWPDLHADVEDDGEDDDWEDEVPVEEEDDDEDLPHHRVVVAGRLVPRGLVAIRVGEQWLAPVELARTAH